MFGVVLARAGGIDHFAWGAKPKGPIDTPAASPISVTCNGGAQPASRSGCAGQLQSPGSGERAPPCQKRQVGPDFPRNPPLAFTAAHVTVSAAWSRTIGPAL